MSNVVQFNGQTTKDIDVDQMLEANKGSFQTLIFCGYDNDGKFQCGSSVGDTGKVLILLELFKGKLLEGIE